MRIAYFGGSFDPPHLGHLRIARAALERLGLDRVLFAPTGWQPLKRGGAAPFADRLAMVELLIHGEERLEASAVDAPLEGAPNYTVQTLARLRASLPEGTKLFFLTGADSFLSLAKWREPEGLLYGGQLLDAWILAARPGFGLDELERALPAGYEVNEPVNQAGPVVARSIDPFEMPLYILPDLDDPASATEIRAAVAAGEPTPALPYAVREYIVANRLYKPVLR